MGSAPPAPTRKGEGGEAVAAANAQEPAEEAGGAGPEKLSLGPLADLRVTGTADVVPEQSRALKAAEPV